MPWSTRSTTPSATSARPWSIPSRSLAQSTDQMASLRELVKEMESGAAELLVILGGNPAYTAPADLDFARAVRKVPRAIHLGLYADETSALCRWHVPEAHEFESWGDARAFDGTVSLLQPLIAPLYGGISSYELLASLLEDAGRSGYDIVRDYWRGQKLGGDDFEAAWETALHDGLIAGTALAPKQVTLKPEAVTAGAAGPGASSPALEISFRPDPTIWDGRFANNGWLQELPKPMTKLTWDNAALVSPRTAESLGLDNEDLVELRYRGRSVRGPGLDRARARRRLRDGEPRLRPDAGGPGGQRRRVRRQRPAHLRRPRFGAGLEIRKTGRKYPLACTQVHRSLEGRNLYRVGDAGAVPGRPPLRPRGACGAQARHVALSPVVLRGERLGDGGQPEYVRRVQRLRRGLPGGEQHPGRRQGGGPARPGDALAGDRPLFQRGSRRPGDLPPAQALHALRERPLRGRLPGRRHDAQRRGAERDDVQPLRRHAVLPEQLPLQGPALQLLRVLRRRGRRS